jgi:hypothetical protein
MSSIISGNAAFGGFVNGEKLSVDPLHNESISLGVVDRAFEE